MTLEGQRDCVQAVHSEGWFLLGQQYLVGPDNWTSQRAAQNLGALGLFVSLTKPID